MKLYVTDQLYSEYFLRAYPDYVFLFGDNLQGVGTGGQAEIRGEPNALGIPTKRTPSMNEAAFFEDHSDEVMCVLKHLAYAERYDHVVMPCLPGTQIPSLGCGLAQLPARAPRCYIEIVLWTARYQPSPLPIVLSPNNGVLR